jgi:glycine/D-amino acid oxidase-like deaminating enzyme
MPLDMAVLRDMAGQVTGEAPLATSVPVAEHRGGMFTMSPDGRVVAGPVPDAPGLWVASGCNGSGFSSSPAIGEALAGWITGGDPGALATLAPDRFPAMTDELLIKNGAWQYAHYYDPVSQQGNLPAHAE